MSSKASRSVTTAAQEGKKAMTGQVPKQKDSECSDSNYHDFACQHTGLQDGTASRTDDDLLHCQLGDLDLSY